MMILLLTTALWAQETACFPSTVDKLTADDIDVREQAVAELIQRGATAVPAIRRALEKATDAELRGRLAQALKALTEIRWMVDLDAARKAAALEKKPLLVYATRAGVNGWN
jgi:hypothetical protein